MRLIYSNENRFIVGNARNILEANGFAVFLKNEHAVAAVGELSAFDAWPELWLLNDEDYTAASELLANALSDPTATPWLCTGCGEENDAAFELCWQCGQVGA